MSRVSQQPRQDPHAVRSGACARVKWAVDVKSVSDAHLRAARALLGITGEEIAAITKLTLATVRRAEQGGTERMTFANAERLIHALEGLGVLFLEPGKEGGPGVRLGQ